MFGTLLKKHQTGYDNRSNDDINSIIMTIMLVLIVISILFVHLNNIHLIRNIMMNIAYVLVNVAKIIHDNATPAIFSSYQS